MANVFVSYRNADVAEAERLALEIRRRGHNVWLDVWKTNIGDSVVEQINDGLAGSRYVVLCYSSTGGLAPWMSREWMSALARQLRGTQVRLLPVRLTGGQPPAILADIMYADLVADWEAGVNALCSSIL